MLPTAEYLGKGEAGDKAVSLEEGLAAVGANNSRRRRRDSFAERHSQGSIEGSTVLHRIAHTAHSQWSVVRRHPYVVVIPAVLFVVLCSTGLGVIFGLNEGGSLQTKEEIQAVAEDVARVSGEWFTERFGRAVQPALALSRVVKTYAEFQNLPGRIGNSGTEGSLPLFQSANGQSARDVTDVCGTNSTVNRFESVTLPLLDTTGVKDAIVNLKLAPMGVICLVVPTGTYESTLNNESGGERHLHDEGENGGHGVSNSTVREELEQDVGIDLVASSRNRRFLDAISSGEVQLRAFRESLDVEGGIELVIPIESDEYLIEVEGKSYPRWGLVITTIDWLELVRNSPVWKSMRDEHLEFRLHQATGTNQNIADVSVTLAESQAFSTNEVYERPGNYIVSVEFEFEFDTWIMDVAYEFTETKPWRQWATIVCVVLSFSIAMVAYLVLLHTQIQAISESEKTALILESAKLSAKKERELNEFLAHEVRNPVSAAISACTFVSSAVNDTEPLTDQESIQCVRDDVKIIHTSLQFVNDLLRTMLDIHRADSKLLKVERCATDVRMDIFDPVACMLQPHESMYRVEVECPPGLVVETDRMRLKQIILNLGRNSSKFVEQGFVRLRAVVIDCSLFLYVEDSGPGIPEEKRHKLFKKFQDSLDTLNQGTGVGLHLCRSLVELMDGEIWLDESYHSGVDDCPGARFVVRLDGAVVLPSDSMATETLTSVSSEHELSDASYRRDDIGMQCVPSLFPSEHSDCRSLPVQFRVLFVDDDTVLRKLFVRAVKKVRSDWIIEEAASGEAALHMVEQQSYDLIFVDQYMASVTKSLLGTETVRVLRGKGVTNTICGLSANDMAGAFVAAGANTFSMKPFPCKKEELTAELLRIIYDSSLSGSDVPTEVL